MKSWKDIEGYEGLYQVSKSGEIRNVVRNRILSDGCCYQAYRQVSLRKNGESKSFMAHRLVAKAFIANPENKKFVNHKNYKRRDNRSINLEWCTAKENMAHAMLR